MDGRAWLAVSCWFAEQSGAWLAAIWAGCSRGWATSALLNCEDRWLARSDLMARRKVRSTNRGLYQRGSV
jgi:hypothetical protein